MRWINTIKYDTHAKLPRVKVPVLVMHSRADDLIPFHHAERNFAAANASKLFCEVRGAHNETPCEQPEFRQALEQFLKMSEEFAGKTKAAPR